MRNPACPRSVRLLPLLLLPLATLLVAGSARAQVSVGDRRCIEEINNGTRKTLLAENKAVNGCMRSFVKGTLATPTVAQCAAPAASIKVQKEVDRSLANANKRCVGAPPSFGPPSISNHPTAAVQAGTGTLADLFGPAVEGTLLTDKDGNRCQDQVHKAVLRCEDTRLKEFLTCKRNAMKTGIATDAATLESACFGTGPDQPDPKGKIALACSSKVQKQVDTRCVAEGINLAVAFPACAALSGPSLTACLDSRVRCRTCDLLNTVDGLAKDCDLYDDGNDSNSSCSEPTTCGDGTVDGTEICDDGNVAAGDGCNASCQTELGWTCTGAPSACAPVCGDGLLTGGEACDDSNTAPGDGCSATCTVESGYSCSGAPSVCLANCGDGLVNGPETCDDGGLSSGDGCSASCQTESGWICSGAPSSCNTVCGDGIVAGAEACDDDGTAAGDGCSATCTIETGYTCSGSPSSCSATCGDGLIIGDEECDDGGLVPGDGCDASCDIEAGFACSGAPSLCSRFDVIITSPANGSFTTAATATIEGVVTQLAPALASLTVNGVAVPVAGDGTFSTEVTLAPSAIFNPVRATVTDTVHGGVAHDRVVVIWGDSVTDGGLSPETVALRLNDTGLDQVEPLVADLAGAGLNLADLVPVDTVLINNQCFATLFGACVGRATVKVTNPPPSFSSFALAADSMTNFVAGDITVNNIRVDVFLDGTGVVPDCPITIRANQAFFFGDYELEPDPIAADQVDVNQIGDLAVSFSAFTTTYGGLCNAPVIGTIIQAFLPDVESLTIDAMRDFLSDPDGAGPADSPTADAIETALGGVSIAGPIGAGLGVMLETPLFAVPEDNDGITLASDMRVTTEVGTDPGQCLPPPGAPDLLASLAFIEPFPAFSAVTPVGGIPYDLGIAISAEGFNQLLKGQTECGLLISSINEIDLGTGPIPLTGGLLSLLMPQFVAFPPATPFRIDIRPTLAPVVTGAPGPGGELTELRIANVIASLVADDGSEQVALVMAFDAELGMDLQFAPGGLAVTLSPPAPGALLISIIDNPLGVNEVTLETTILPPLVGGLIPDLASSLASFPVPSFLGLDLSGLEVSRAGAFLSLYGNLVPAP